MSLITLSRQEGISGKARGSWEEDRELMRAVPFEVGDDTGSVTVEHVDDPHRSGFGGLTREATTELEGGAAVPEPIDSAFSGRSPDVASVIEHWKARKRGDHGARKERRASDGTADEGTDPGSGVLGGSAGSGSAAEALEDTSPLLAGVPQKFAERFAAPGDEIAWSARRPTGG